MIATQQATSAGRSTDRLRYGSAHWARHDDEQKALGQYLRLGDKVYNRTKFRLFADFAGDVKGKRILDYGGGAGILSIPYAKAGADVVIVDAEANALRTAQFYASTEDVHARVRVIHSEVFPSSLKHERFDIGLAKDIVEHVDGDRQLLRDLGECQATGDVLILSTQNSRSLNYLLEGSYRRYWCGNRSWMGWDATHVRFYTPASISERYAEAGYKPDRWAGVYIIPYDLLSWMFLLKIQVELPILHYFDLTLGRCFPFNRLGWNVVVRGVKA